MEMKITNLYQGINTEYSYNVRPKLLLEANLKDLYNKAKKTDMISDKTGKGYIDRGLELVNKTRYFGLSEDGTFNFKVNSQTNPGKFHYVYVQASLDDIEKLYAPMVSEDLQHLQAKDLNQLLLTNNFRIGCNCQAYLYYGFKYMATIELK